MNDKILHRAGDTKLTKTIWLQDALSGAFKTGVNVADLDYRYIRIETDNDVTVSAAADVVELADLDADHVGGKMFEIDRDGIPFGAYRLDFPDAMVAAGASFAEIFVWDAVGDTILPMSIEVQLDALTNPNLNIIGVTEGGTYNLQKVIKILAAWVAGNWRDKGGGVSELLDAEDGSTVILEMTVSTSTPYRSITIKI